MNYTLDDDSTLLVFSNGWGVQNSQNPYLDQYFLQTYHVAQTDGASLNLTFPGSYPYVAIYGSKGPGHADYSVQFDDTVIDLSANTEQTQFRQILFQRALPNITTDHFVRLVADFGQSESAWLDIDYVVIADGSAPTTTAAPVATLTPPYVSGSLSTSGSSSPSATTVSSSSSSSSSKVPTILAIIFGVLIGLALIIGFVYFILRRSYDRRHARERQFRYGAAPTTPKQSGFSGSISAEPDEVIIMTQPTRPRARGILNGLLNPSSQSLPSQAHAATGPSASAGALGPAYVQVPVLSPPPEGGHVSPAMTKETSATQEGSRRTATPAFSFLTHSPIAFQKHKGDADSLRTDFLQV